MTIDECRIKGSSNSTTLSLIGLKENLSPMRCACFYWDPESGDLRREALIKKTAVNYHKYNSTSRICPVNFFKEGIGPGVCVSCPANMSSPEGAFSALDCGCDAGYGFNESSSACETCSTGTYSNSRYCMPCEAGKIALSPCLTACALCGAGLGSVNATMCETCVAGTFSGTNSTVLPFAGECESCLAGTYTNGGDCMPCEAGKVVLPFQA